MGVSSFGRKTRCIQFYSNPLTSNLSEVLSKGTKILETRCVDSMEEVNGSRRAKSRLCVKGCQEDKFKCPSTFASTASKETIMAAVHTISAKRWKMRAMNVEKVVLQSAEIEPQSLCVPSRRSGTPSKHSVETN